MGAYSRWGAYLRLGDHQPSWPSGLALIRGWALFNLLGHQGGRLLEVGRLFEVGRSSTFLAIRVGAYARLGDCQTSWSSGWALTRGWALINLLGQQSGRLFEVGRSSTFLAIRVGAYWRLGAYKPSLPSGWVLMGAYSRLGDYQPSWPSGWALMRGWAIVKLLGHQGGRLLEVGRL